MFYISSHKYKGSVEVLGVTDTDDNIEEFYTEGYLLSTGLEIIRLNKELEEGYKFRTKCFEFKLVKLNGILGWGLKARQGLDTFGNKPYYFGYPVISMKYCFEDYKAGSLDLRGMDTSQVITMGNMFYRCTELTSLDLSSFSTSNVIATNSMFYKCDSLTSLDLSSFSTSNVKNMNCMFYKCNSLTSLDLSNFDTHNVESMELMFSCCERLTSLDLSSFSITNVKNMLNIFDGCDSLKLVYICASKLSNELGSDILIAVSKSSGIKYDKLLKSKKDIPKYLLMLSNYKVVAYEEE